MRLSRTDLLPMLTIVAGGALGVLVTVTALVPRSPSDEVSRTVRVVPVPSPDAQPRVEEVDLSAAPAFTPMTVRPEIRNRSEVQAALMKEYPTILRDAGIGGRVVVWMFISEEGEVLNRRVSESSSHVALDEAALEVADVFRFTPALNRDRIVQVWIQLPITFQVR